MLCLKERQKVLTFFHLASILCQLPVRVNPQQWQIHSGCGSKWRLLACTVSISLFLANSMYKVLSLIYTFSFFTNVPLHQITIQVEFAAAVMVFVFWYYILHVKNSWVNCQVTRLTLTAAITGGTSRQCFISFTITFEASPVCVAAATEKLSMCQGMLQRGANVGLSVFWMAHSKT